MDIVLVTTIIASLFLVIAAADPLAARLRLPYSVILACLGMLIGVGAIFFLRTELTDALNPVAEAILGLPIRSKEENNNKTTAQRIDEIVRRSQ